MYIKVTFIIHSTMSFYQFLIQFHQFPLPIFFQVVTWGEKIFTANQPLTELGSSANGDAPRVLRLSASQRAFAALLEDGDLDFGWGWDGVHLGSLKLS